MAREPTPYDNEAPRRSSRCTAPRCTCPDCTAIGEGFVILTALVGCILFFGALVLLILAYSK